MSTINIIILVSGLVGGLIAGTVIARSHAESKSEELEKEASRLMKEAKALIEKHEFELAERELSVRKKMSELQEASNEREVNITKRIELKSAAAEKREQKNQEKVDAFMKIYNEIEAHKLTRARQKEEFSTMLMSKAKTDKEQAKAELLSNLEKEFIGYFETRASKVAEMAKETCNKESVHILKSIMQKYSEPSSVDHLDKLIKLSKDIVKGRLIGKEGRNIARIEELTGADIIFDNEPGFITVSCFNLVNQEIARIAIKKLINLAVIDEPAIDKALEEARVEMNKELLAVGSRAATVIGITHTDPEFLKLIGRLKYRTSYGQNILYHSMEIGYFSAMMASEIGADIEVAKLGGFLHDIGKAIDQETGGSHDQLTKEILEKFGFSDEIVHAAWTHHDAIPIETVEAQIVKAADAISAGRPGARTESAGMYFERIQGLESLAIELEGVKKAYAVSAGREIRTIVDEDMVSDKQMEEMANSLARSIEETLVYPGKIKVNLIRVVEAIGYATGKEEQPQLN